MGTTPTTPLLPHLPTAPVLMTITTHCNPQMPVLYLTPLITISQKALLPTTSSIQSFYTGLQQSQSVNPVSTLATRKQHFPMTVAFHSHESTTQPCLTRGWEELIPLELCSQILFGINYSTMSEARRNTSLFYSATE